MITGRNERVVELYGLSTDKKPINNYIENGSSFIEMDTSIIYKFDKASMKWIPTTFGNGSESGGGGETGPELTEEEVDNMLEEVFG